MRQDRPSGDPFACTFAELPDRLPIFPLGGVLLLPGGRLPLNIFEPRYLAMVLDSLGDGRLIGMVQPQRPGGFAGDGISEHDGLPPAVQPIGCAGRICAFNETGDGRLHVTLAGVCRFAVADELEPSPRGYRLVRPDFARFADDMRDGASPAALDRDRLMAALKGYFAANNLSTDWKALERINDQALITTICMAAPFDVAEKQALLEAADDTLRGKLLLALLEQSHFASERKPDDQPRH